MTAKAALLLALTACTMPPPAVEDSSRGSTASTSRQQEPGSHAELIQFEELFSAGTTFHMGTLGNVAHLLLTGPCDTTGSQPAFLDRNGRLLFLRTGGSCQLVEVFLVGSSADVNAVWKVRRVTRDDRVFFPDRYEVASQELDLVVTPDCQVPTETRVIVSAYTEEDTTKRTLIEALTGSRMVTDLPLRHQLSMVDFETGEQCDLVAVAVSADRFIASAGSISLSE